MQNITLSADEHFIEQYASDNQDKERRVQQYDVLMEKWGYVSTGGKRFSRDDMNER